MHFQAFPALYSGGKLHIHIQHILYVEFSLLHHIKSDVTVLETTKLVKSCHTTFTKKSHMKTANMWRVHMWTKNVVLTCETVVFTCEICRFTCEFNILHIRKGRVTNYRKTQQSFVFPTCRLFLSTFSSTFKLFQHFTAVVNYIFIYSTYCM